MKKLIISIISIMSFIFCVEKSNIGIWFREVPHQVTGEIMVLELDMTAGFAVADQYTIYIIVHERNTDKLIRMAFQNGTQFVTDGSYWESTNDEFHDDDIHDHLKQGKEIEKDKK